MFSKITSLFKSKKPEAVQTDAQTNVPTPGAAPDELPVAPELPVSAEPSADVAVPPPDAANPVAFDPPGTETPAPSLPPEDDAQHRPAETATQAESPVSPAPEPPTPAPAKFNSVDEPAPATPEPPKEKLGFFARIKQGLARTSSQFAEGLGNLFLGKKAIDDELLEDLETQLLVADVGIEATTVIIDDLTARVARKQLNDSDALFAALQENLRNLLLPVEQPLVITGQHKPFVILVIGVNGAGKTTTIGKLAHRFLGEGKSVMLAAGDTFRAAAVEQLQVWGERNKVPVIAQHTGADSASVIFDALNAAKARQVDVLIADTAGRLHNKSHLMEELIKVKRVLAKIDPDSPHETLLVLDAGTGQNAVNQCDQFHQSLGVTGLALTKLDGTAKGGIIFALSQKHKIPVRFIGVGETLEDLQPFAARPFVDALFGKNTAQ
ncbi:MAG: signal recognition particle-docking protein FtsY [Pseudomonadota bacterium]|jgi:fused signal recognition particle receptor